MQLTPGQAEIVGITQYLILHNKRYPTVLEMMAYLRVSSLPMVQTHLKELWRYGLLERVPELTGHLILMDQVEPFALGA